MKTVNKINSALEKILKNNKNSLILGEDLLDPYGGAATGIGGILRDGVCMGAQPIALVDPLFFGDLDLPRKKLPEGVKHPQYLMGGVVAGIRDYGYRVGFKLLSMLFFVLIGNFLKIITVSNIKLIIKNKN